MRYKKTFVGYHFDVFSKNTSSNTWVFLVEFHNNDDLSSKFSEFKDTIERLTRIWFQYVVEGQVQCTTKILFETSWNNATWNTTIYRLFSHFPSKSVYVEVFALYLYIGESDMSVLNKIIVRSVTGPGYEQQ